MIRQGRKLYPGQIEKISDLCAGIFNSTLGIGQILGPLYGSNVKEFLGFRTTCDIFALIAIAYAFLYLVLGTGWQGF